MLSLTIVKLIILLFLGSLALVRKAQNEFYTGTDQNHLRGLFPFIGGNAGHGLDGVDNGNILKVIDILQNNIKQWSFVESQLMEPNVNLGMPEIFIPLKHLTTTLEILGNIFFVQDDLAAAKESLERACPLMELLPESVQDDDYMASAEDVLGAGGVAVDPAELSSFLWFGGGRNENGLAQPTNLNTDGNRGAATSGYAAGCFSLLRDVYIRLYGTTGGEAEPAAGADPHLKEQPAAATSYAASVDALTRSKYNNNADSSIDGTDSTSGISSTSGPRSLQYPSHNSYRLPDGRPRELNLKYVLSRPQQMQQMKQKRPAERSKRHTGNVGSEEEALLDQLKGGARSPKVTGTRMSMAATTTGSAYKEKSAASKAAQMADQHAHHSADSSDDEGSVFDVEQKLRELRSPYQHLRSEMAGAHSDSTVDSQQHLVHARSRDVPRNSERRGVGLGLSGDSAAAGKRGETAVRGFEGSALNSISGAEITLQGVATSIIADDLEVLLRKFVRASRKGRRDLAKQAAKYFDELDINFPNMDYNEYAANMDVGQAYLEVMARVVDEGFGFIAPELDTAWARIAVENREEQATEDVAGTSKPSAGTAAPSRAALSSKRLGAGEADEAIIASLEKEWGLTFRSAGDDGGGTKAVKDSSVPSVSNAAKKKKKKKTSETPIPKLTMAEKNRLLVLYAFDIVHSDPSDLFDLGLGFTQGIFDNDRTRRGGSPTAAAAVSGDAVHETVDYLRSALKGGLLGGADDAHQRLFPFDSLSGSSLAEEAAYDQRQMKRLTEQHLRDLLVGEGGAEAYLAAKSAAIRKKSAASSNSGGSSVEGAAKSNSRRRRQQRANAGEGEYSVSSEGGSIGIHQRRARDPADSEGDDDLFDEVAGATIGILSASSLRASVPSLGQDGADWTLSIFLLFMMLTAAVVYTANQEAARKRMTTGRNRLRHGGNALGGGGKKASGAWAGGSSIVDFMYAQLGGVGGAPGANATADWDDSVPASVGAGSEAEASAASAQQPSAPAPSSLFVSASSSLNVFLGGLNRSTGLDASAAGPAAQGGPTKPSGAGASKTKRGKDSASQQDALSATAASATAGKGGQIPSSSEAGKNATRASLFGDLLSLMKPTSSTAAASTVHAAAAPAGSATPSPSVSVPKAEGAQKRKEGAGAEATKTTGTGKGKAKKANQKEPSKPVSPPGTNSTSNAAGVTKSAPSSESLNSVSSTSSSDSREGSSSTEGAQFLPPVVMNNRRVSWAGLLPTTTTDSALDFEEGYEGDWAAAKKKGGRKHASTAAATTDGDASKASQKDGASHRSPSKPPPARHNASLSSVAGAAHSTKQLGTARSFAGQPSSSSAALSARNSSKPTPAPVPASVSAAGTAPSAASVGPPDRTKSAAHSAPIPDQKAHDLSEAKLLADQLGRWTLSAPSPVPAAPSRPPVYAPPGLSASPQPSPKSTSFPVAGPAAALSLQPPSRTRADLPASSLHGAFGFSPFDMGPSSSTYAAPSSLWSSVSNPLSLGSNSLAGGGGNVPLSSQTSMSEEGYAVDFETDGYLGDLVSFLDSSPRASPQPQPRSLDSFAPTATYDSRDSSAYSYGAAGVYGEAQYGMTEQGYYGDQTAAMDSYYQQQGQYAAADAHYGYYSEFEESASLWGTRQQQRDSGGHDLAASITLEASSVYGLSPDAPSFKPSTQRRIEGLQPLSFPAPSGVDFRNHLMGGNSGALFPTGASLASSQSPSTSGLFNSEEFYESILIDSILGGEDQKKQGSGTGLSNF